MLAEGIETSEQRDLAVACGVDDLQGYLLGYPLSAERMRALLDARADAVSDLTRPVRAPLAH